MDPLEEKQNGCIGVLSSLSKRSHILYIEGSDLRNSGLFSMRDSIILPQVDICIDLFYLQVI